MATIFIDGKPYEADERQNLLEACLQLGFDLPYFCWHPAMGSVGACRQCAVKTFKDENDDEGTIVMSCMTAVKDGLRLSVDDPEARAFREEVVGWLMVNHPHDCPVCDEGGECHLQDMTVMTGHAYRRYRFSKRTHVNQDLGPFIHHEMNRCIQCYRCVRFYRDVAGGRDLNVFGAHDHVYFGRESDGTLESEFAGNLVEVCPTGVFTDKTLRRHYTRKWDMQMAPSVCVHCSVGCNTSAGERYGSLRRILNRYNHRVNGYFLCDRGRFGYEFVNDGRRLRRPAARRDGGLESVDTASAAHLAAERLARCDRVIGITSSRASLESGFALRELVGPENFFAGVTAREQKLAAKALDILRRGTAPTASVEDVAGSDAVLVLGENLLDTAPRVALALRESVRIQPMRRLDALNIPRWSDAAVRDTIQDDKGPLFVATPDATRFDDLATATLRGAPADIARLGFAVAHAVESPAPAVDGLDADTADLAGSIAAALADAEHPLVIAGTSLGSESVLEAAANVAWALRRRGKHARILLVLPECNAVGAAMLGGRPLEDAFAAAEDGATGVVIVENDLYRHADGRRVDAFLEACRTVVVVDHIEHGTARGADVLLPAATFAEGSGTLVSAEGRAQRFFRVLDGGDAIRDSWRWLRDLDEGRTASPLHGWQRLDDVIAAVAAAEPDLAAIRDAAPDAGTRLAGQLVPRQQPRYSGRTAMRANRTVHEPPPPADPDSPLSMSMEGYRGQPPAALLPSVWSPGWNSVQAVNTYQEEIAGALRGGAAGVRLIEPHQGDAPFFTAVPPAPAVADGSWVLVPVHHVFGSEEMSSLAPGIRARTPAPALHVSPGDAEALGLSDGDAAIVVAGEVRLRLPVRTRPAMPRGVAGVPVGLPDVPWLELPAVGTVAREAS